MMLVGPRFYCDLYGFIQNYQCPMSGPFPQANHRSSGAAGRIRRTWGLATFYNQVGSKPPRKKWGKKPWNNTFFVWLFEKKAKQQKISKKLPGELTILMKQHKLPPLEAMFKKLPQHLMERFRVIQVAFWWEERGWQELKTNNHVILLGIIKKRVKQKYVEISTTTCLYHTTKVPFLDHLGNQKKTHMMICSWEKLSTRRTVQQIQVRKIQELDLCDALVIPGGESTTMKIIAGTDEILGSQMMGNEGRRTKE